MCGEDVVVYLVGLVELLAELADSAVLIALAVFKEEVRASEELLGRESGLVA